MLNKKCVFFFTLLAAMISATMSMAQGLNTVQSAVPFLMVSPDARSGSLGDAGVASTPDENSMHWNPAKYAFIDKQMGVAVNYSPWLHNLVPDISLAYLSGYSRLDKNQTIAASLRYFSLGNIQFTSQFGEPLGDYKPNEFALDFAYSRKFTKTLSGSVAARFIHSNLTLRQDVGSQSTKPGNSVAADVSVYQQLPLQFSSTEGLFAWGVNISNIGAKISYSNDNIRKDFIPTNLRIGSSLTLDLDEYNRMSFMLDFNKLLVPTTPEYSDTNSTVIVRGMDPDVSTAVGMLHSFYDAPDGFSEELREINISTGVEYWYNQQFAVRGGFFYEDPTKGDRTYVTLGAGLRYNVFGLDVSYLVPLATDNPLENTLRFSLLLNFEAVSGGGKK
ncbi:MAG TPA: type IX secretion system outer membrane channel protein PorV [Bacteroidales bacterium]|nr:type IX secretion system outer membrane channel protein PorV [Bacteroidales bacterium]HPT02715.1 type IX secretion system outer membrane channel protein PorV [Bacteroidales bacterium]